jgi:hypothetical protein
MNIVDIDYKFWVPFLVSLLGLYWTKKQVAIMEAAQSGASPVSKLTSSLALKRYWPVGVMSVLMLACWIPYFFSRPIIDINDPRIELRNTKPGEDYITLELTRTGLACHRNPYFNNLHCFVIPGEAGSGTFDVVWIFLRPLQYSGVTMYRKNGEALASSLVRLGDVHDKNVMQLTINDDVKKELPITIKAVNIPYSPPQAAY